MTNNLRIAAVKRKPTPLEDEIALVQSCVSALRLSRLAAGHSAIRDALGSLEDWLAANMDAAEAERALVKAVDDSAESVMAREG